MADENNEKQSGALDLSALGSFDFTPEWAKGKPGDAAKFTRFEASDDAREARPRFGGGDRGPRRDDRGPRRDDRPRFGQSGDRGPRRDDRPRSGQSGDRGPRRDDRPRFGGGDRGPRRDFVPAMAVDVRILPGQKQLGDFMRRIQAAPFMAYPIKQLAHFFLDHPEACVLRVTPKKDAAEPIAFHQCKACGFVAFSEDELMAHVVAAHLGDYYVREDVACEAPKGAFTCVAKCGLSGVLLGPPNLHGFDARVREMVRTRYPNMSEEAYRAHIEMVRDPEAVEAWRASATTKTIFRLKGTPAQEAAAKTAAKAEPAAEGAAEAAPAAEAPTAPALEREAAELEFRRTIAPSLLSAPKSVDLSAEMALKSTNRAFLFACRDALAKEKRFPASLVYALRGAFHHRKLQFFRANDPRGPEFVTSVKPTPLDTAHAIPELVELVHYVEAHPDQSPGAVVAALGAGDAAKTANAKAHIMWLLEKGHIVCYANGGGLVPPADHPRWNPQRPKKDAKPAAEKPAEETPAEKPAEPVPEAKPKDEKPAEPAPEAPVPAAPAPEAPAPAEPANP